MAEHTPPIGYQLMPINTAQNILNSALFLFNNFINLK